MFKIGDKVKVVDSGKCYTAYSEMAEMLELTRWNRGVCICNGREYTVIGKSFRRYNKELIYAVCDEKQEYLIDGEGLSAVPVENKYSVTYDLVKEDGRYVVTVAGTNLTTARAKFQESFGSLKDAWRREIVSIERL